MLTKYALVAIVVLCFTALGFTLMVRDSLCELSIKERGCRFNWSTQQLCENMGLRRFFE
ncbi:Hok/Gef family protein [Citrobacter youngae]|uniref:Hok/Gef family protein n=1 Tax=Citrobacter youngae TaxID=133448 RepID=UPI003B982370